MERRAIEDVLVIHIQAELPLSEHHQRERASVDLGSTVQSVQPSLRYLLGVCLELIKNEVDNHDVSCEHREVEGLVPLARLSIVNQLEAAALIISKTISYSFNEKIDVVEADCLQDIKLFLHEPQACDLQIRELKEQRPELLSIACHDCL